MTKITYNGKTTELADGYIATLPCKDLKMETDVVVEAPEGSGVAIAEWNGSIAYNPDAIVIFEKIYYVCIKATAAGSVANNPSVTPSEWKRLNGAYKGEYNSSTTYYLGDIVLSNNNLYQSKIDNPETTPDNDMASRWTLLHEGSGGGSGTSATIKPLTVTEVGTYEGGNPLQIGIPIKFKKVITAEDFEAYMAKATPTSINAMGGFPIYTFGGGWEISTMAMGDTTIYSMSNMSEGMMYALNGSAMGVADGWNSIVGGGFAPSDAVPSVTFSRVDETLLMSTSIEDASCLLDIDEIADAFAPIVVNSPALTVLIEGSNGDGEANSDMMVSIVDDRAVVIGSNRLSNTTRIKSIFLPNVETVRPKAAEQCYSLQYAHLPKATSLGNDAFNYCPALREVVFPIVTTMGYGVFSGCSKLAKADFSSITEISSTVFQNCFSLTTVIIRTSMLCPLADTSAFSGAYRYHGTVDATYNPDGLKDGYIYVPKALIEGYKVATNWSKFADQFRAIEDYPEICGEV